MALKTEISSCLLKCHLDIQVEYPAGLRTSAIVPATQAAGTSLVCPVSKETRDEWHLAVL